ncbi:MAG: hypothetical protein Q9217_002026 [Psora testacea]
MASIPQQAPGQSQAQQEAASPSTHENASTQHQRKSSIPQSATSEDSQTVLLNHPSSSESSPKPSPSPEAQQQSRPKPQASVSSTEPRKCWICLQTEDEDTPASSPWRSPCRCALQAHEDCLLDWVADLQRPKPGQAPQNVQCPQCKTPISIWRPRSYVTELVQRLVRMSERLVLPTTALTLAGGMLYGCYIHGLSSVYIIFGTEDADRLLGVSSGHGVHSNLDVVLPVIPIALILSRTTYVDNFIPVLPIFYLAVSRPSRQAPLWPPSAAMTLVTLPYLRAAYNGAYKYLFAKKEESWVKEIQPRSGGGADDDDQQGQGQPNGNGDGMNIELGIQLEIIDEEEMQGDDPQPPVQPVPIEAQAEGQAPPQEGQQPGGQPQDPAQNQDRAQNAMNAIPIRVNVIIHRIIGALLFPTIASSLGVALKIALPRTWTSPPSRWDKYPAGFLQSKFGRSIAGGCLFIVLKDSLLLYSKYKMAQTHRQRRILDFDTSKGRKGI